MIVLYILLAIVIFGVLIGVHEGGHFISAKLCGVKVNEFAIGMGPAIIKKQKGETLYSLRAIPIGGYCAMAGEDEQSDDPRAFTNQSPLKRIIILVSGAAMNFLLGLIIVLVLFSNAAGFRSTQISGFMDGCPYQGAGSFEEGDYIYSIDGHRIYQYSDVSEYLALGNGEHDVVVKRDGARVKLSDLELVPVEYEGYEQKMYGFYFGVDEPTVMNKLKYSWNTTMEFGRWVVMGLQQLINGQVKVSDMSGPVGIVDLMAETGEQAENASDAMFGIFYIAAFIAVNLAMMNLLPIPALDGGRVFLLLVTCVIEAITRKKLDSKYEAYIHAAGMILLLALMAVVMFNDILRIVKSL